MHTLIRSIFSHPSRVLIAASLMGLIIFCSTIAYADLDQVDITDVSDDGSVIKTDDGFVWLIDSADRVNTQLWLVTDTIVEDDNSKACDHFQLINTDEDGETACAKKIE